MRRLPVRPSRPGPSGPLRIHFLVFGIDGLGGTVRTVLNIAGYLVEHGHEVHLIPVYRTRADPFFAIDERIRMEPLCDERERRTGAPGGGLGGAVRRFLHRRTSWLVHETDNRFERCSLWTDLQIIRRLWSIRGGVLVTTKESLNLIGARFSRPGVATLAQEHLTFDAHGPEMQREIKRHFGKLDAVAVLTGADERAYREALSGKSTRIVRVSNALPREPALRCDPAARRVIASGRLAWMKGFDLLVEAFAEATREHPDWELRIYGSGPWKQKIRRLVDKHGLTGRILLMGATDRMAQEMAKGSIFALSSRFEPFGMVLTEALSSGLAVVSFDCPHGPREIITHGRNGLLVPPKDVRALADGLRRLIEDEDLRRRLGSTGPTTLGAYSMEAIGPRWEQLFHDLSR